MCLQVDGGWGYCSPRTVFTQDSCVQDSTQFYAIVGDCDRWGIMLPVSCHVVSCHVIMSCCHMSSYIRCREATPVLSSCEPPLHFDYILRRWMSRTYWCNVHCPCDVTNIHPQLHFREGRPLHWRGGRAVRPVLGYTLIQNLYSLQSYGYSLVSAFVSISNYYNQ